MLTRQQKEKIVEDLTEKFKKQKIAIFGDLRGISVARSQTLRRQLKKDEAELKIAKKTLFDLAIKQADIDFSAKKLQGEVGVAFGYGDQVSPAKTLLRFGKANETFKILGGILNGRLLQAKDIVNLAKLPSREVLLARLLGALQSPMRGLVNALGGNTKNLVAVLNKIKDKK